MVRGRHIVVGVCGGVAAYKAVEVVRQLTALDARVSVMMTDNAQRFIGAATFAALSHEPVRTSLWEAPEPSPHTTLGQGADAIVIVPATARLIGEYANGISSDLLVSTLLATRAPVVIAPAMHTEMWEQSSVQHNLSLLRDRSVVVVDPESGALAGGDAGMGRLAATDRIISAIERSIAPGPLFGLRVLVTAGGTREAIDPIRYIGNRSSGKQGYALAEVAAERGALVTLITTVERPIAPDIEVIPVETAEEMRDCVLQALAQKDVVIMNAAVADFRPANVAENKIKKDGGVPSISLEPTADILKEIAAHRTPDQTIVGFAAETNNVRQYAVRKIHEKNLDVIVANNVVEEGSRIAGDTNRVTIVDKHGRESTTSVISKRMVAMEIWDHVTHLRGLTDVGSVD
jgi:phosphopantothenoylcysteine decarboxylase / phosphopantothenate---cysteine ligase